MRCHIPVGAQRLTAPRVLIWGGPPRIRQAKKKKQKRTDAGAAAGAAGPAGAEPEAVTVAHHEFDNMLMPPLADMYAGPAAHDPTLSMSASEALAHAYAAGPAPKKTKRGKAPAGDADGAAALAAGAESMASALDGLPEDAKYLFDGKWHTAAEWRELKEKYSASPGGCVSRRRVMAQGR